MGRAQEHVVVLADRERAELERLVRQGRHSARVIIRARVLLLSDRSEAGSRWSDQRIAEALGVCASTAARIRARFGQVRLDAIRRAPHRRYKPRKLDGEAEARLIALACGAPPEGHSQWSLRLLADQLVFLDIVESIGHEAVRRALKKTNLSLGRKNAGVSRQPTTPPCSAPWKKC